MTETRYIFKSYLKEYGIFHGMAGFLGWRLRKFYDDLIAYSKHSTVFAVAVFGLYVFQFCSGSVIPLPVYLSIYCLYLFSFLYCYKKKLEIPSFSKFFSSKSVDVPVPVRIFRAVYSLLIFVVLFRYIELFYFAVKEVK